MTPKEMLDAVAYHAPRIRLGDSIAGAGLGLAVSALPRVLNRNPEERRLKRQDLWAALAGAGLVNLAGDRYRRYLSNAPRIVGYDAGQTRPNPFRVSWKEVSGKMWADAPAADRSQLNPYQDFDMISRREMFRRSMGLPVRPEESVLRPVGLTQGLRRLVALDPDSKYWNPSNEHVRRTSIEAFPPRLHMLGRHNLVGDKALSIDFNQDGFLQTQGELPTTKATVIDDWDFMPTPDEWKTAFRPNPKPEAPAPGSAPAPAAQLESPAPYHPAQKSNLLLRFLADRLLLNNGGVRFQQTWDPSGKPIY